MTPVQFFMLFHMVQVGNAHSFENIVNLLPPLYHVVGLLVAQLRAPSPNCGFCEFKVRREGKFVATQKRFRCGCISSLSPAPAPRPGGAVELRNGTTATDSRTPYRYLRFVSCERQNPVVSGP